ncbi:MAG: hypothetical protein D3923_05605 [Candidatus Electrothrix sp. AR3]|nr:hypothetical protein [Candidatus Electrothrix sp. AR3]
MSLLHNWLKASTTPKKKGHIVLGNQAADLDSMASSIAYALLCALLQPREPTLPLMPIPRADFFLRREAVYVFQQAGIELDYLVFWDEIDLISLPEAIELVLVDHNILAPALEQFRNRVGGILDHHVDEGHYPAAEPRIIQPVGSCASLVALEFKKHGVILEADIAILLAGTVLLDTGNLHQTTAADQAAAAYVLPFCPLHQDEYFQTIRQEKYNVQGLSTDDLLRKDYKEWCFGSIRCGIASVRLSLEDWLVRDRTFTAGLTIFAEQRGLDLLFSMHSYTKLSFQRELIIFCRTAIAIEPLLEFLQAKGLEFTSLVDGAVEQPVHGVIACYRQHNPMISRKKLQPLLALFFANFSDNIFPA